ncbi:hypothetical protein ABKW28_09510 [Nocardioides sp. 31GB23]|uniref:hypothetical protein n=1 Tax=Nocardioides sp. 31GB23 TaxID=3156065 RepID=UPI0032AF61C1
MSTNSLESSVTIEAADGSGVSPRPTTALDEHQVERQPVISRSAERLEPEPAPTRAERMLEPGPTRAAVRRASKKRWTTAPLNIWKTPAEKSRLTGLLERGSPVLVTGRSLRGRVEVVLDGRSRWVTQGYLVDDLPEPEPTEAIKGSEEDQPVDGNCTNGTSVPSGVSPNIVEVHQAVCAAFPEISTYGTLRSDGEHAQGIAVDIMVSGDAAWQVANFVRQNSSRLGVSYVIHAQNIWSVQRNGEGWRSMEDRGSVTANHYDHVHVTTN